MEAHNHNGRNGRFTLGNSGGPGRPRRAVEREYLDALTAAIPLDDWREVVARAVVDAKAGDARARDWLARYLIGNPTPADHADSDLPICPRCQQAAVSRAELQGRLAALACKLGVEWPAATLSAEPDAVH